MKWCPSVFIVVLQRCTCVNIKQKLLVTELEQVVPPPLRILQCGPCGMLSELLYNARFVGQFIPCGHGQRQYLIHIDVTDHFKFVLLHAACK
jgi:hypothetical protein